MRHNPIASKEPDYKQLWIDAQKAIDQFTDEEWKSLGSWSQERFRLWGSSRNGGKVITNTALHTKWKVLSDIWCKTRGRPYPEKRSFQEDVGLYWNRKRRRSYNRTGQYQHLRDQKQKEINEKRDEFNQCRMELSSEIRQLVSEAIVFDHKLAAGTFSKQDLQQLRRLVWRISNTATKTYKSGVKGKVWKKKK